MFDLIPSDIMILNLDLSLILEHVIFDHAIFDHVFLILVIMILTLDLITLSFDPTIIGVDLILIFVLVIL